MWFTVQILLTYVKIQMLSTFFCNFNAIFWEECCWGGSWTATSQSLERSRLFDSFQSGFKHLYAYWWPLAELRWGSTTVLVLLDLSEAFHTISLGIFQVWRGWAWGPQFASLPLLFNICLKLLGEVIYQHKVSIINMLMIPNFVSQPCIDQVIRLSTYPSA